MTSDELCAEMRRITGDEVILMFSRGKDSIASYYQLKRFFKKIHLVYKYNVPNLTFVNESIKYFEDKFGEKIIQIPSSELFKKFNKFLYQSPQHAEIILKVDLPTHTFKVYDEYLPKSLKCQKAYKAHGVRAFDTLMRRMVIKKHGAVNPKNKTFYPIFDWDIKRVKDCLNENKIKLPVDYELWGKSFDGLDYRFIKPLKDRFPDDYQKIKEMFPLIDLEIMRYENI